MDQKVSEPSLPLVEDGEEGEAVTTTWIEPLGALHLGVVLSHLLKHPWRDLGLHELLEIRLAVASRSHLRETDHG